jgi:SAM-dependent methyltransferase
VETADVVTASQALHWMEPEPTFAEVTRILRPGGVFAAYDHEWPPAVHPDVDAAWERVMDLLGVLDPPWKLEHATRMRASGHFRYVREVLLHGVEEGDSERVAGLVLALGPIVRGLEEGATEEELGLTDLRAVADRVLGDHSVPWLFSYRVRVGVR